MCIGLMGILCQPLNAASSDAVAYVFSDVRPVGDVENYIGNEIVVQVDPTSRRVTGQWDVYLGRTPLTIRLVGELRGSRLRMRGVDSDLRPMLTASFSERQLSGIMIWQFDSEIQKTRVHLHRVPGRLQDLRFIETAGWKRKTLR